MLLQAEKRILRKFQKQQAAQMEIHALLGKVYSDELALDLNRQSAKYARLQEKAEGTLKKEGEKPKPQGLFGTIQMLGSHSDRYGVEHQYGTCGRNSAPG